MRNTKGFTLIEVVVVTLIIAVLAVMVAPSFKNSTVTNDMEKAKMALIEYTNAVKLYNEINPNNPISGWFVNSQLQNLTNGTNNNIVYLQNPGGNRWHIGEGSKITFLQLNCIFGYMPATNQLARAMCRLPKYDDEEGTDCYWFVIYKSDPLIIKKERQENCDTI